MLGLALLPALSPQVRRRPQVPLLGLQLWLTLSYHLHSCWRRLQLLPHRLLQRPELERRRLERRQERQLSAADRP